MALSNGGDNMKNSILIIALILVNSHLQAQQLSFKLKDYPQSVVIRVYDIVQKVGLTEDKQLKLANLYLTRDNDIAAAILNGASKTTIDKLKVKYEVLARDGLSIQEIELIYKPDYIDDGFLHVTTSKFFTAYKYSKDLNLTQSQIDSILANGRQFEKEMANHKNKDGNSPFNAQGYENIVLPKILSEAQFNFLFAIKFKELSTATAIEDWKEAQKRGLTTNLDSQLVVPEMIKYTMERRAISDRYKKDAVKRNVLLQNIDQSTPELIEKLKYARRYGNPLDEKGNLSKDSY